MSIDLTLARSNTCCSENDGDLRNVSVTLGEAHDEDLPIWLRLGVVPIVVNVLPGLFCGGLGIHVLADTSSCFTAGSLDCDELARTILIDGATDADDCFGAALDQAGGEKAVDLAQVGTANLVECWFIRPVSDFTSRAGGKNRDP